jgi:hypothetical protein
MFFYYIIGVFIYPHTNTFVSVNHMQVTYSFYILHSQLLSHPTLILMLHLSVITIQKKYGVNKFRIFITEYTKF